MTRDASDNPAKPPAGVALCAISDLADPGSKGFRFRQDSKMFAGFVVRIGEEIRGYVDSCPHAGWPLAAWDDRYLTREGDLILCGGHAALFRPLDGVCIAGPCADERLTPWPITVVDGQIVTA